MLTIIPDPDHLKNPPPKGKEAQWLKARRQANRRIRCSPNPKTEKSQHVSALASSPPISLNGIISRRLNQSALSGAPWLMDAAVGAFCSAVK